MKNIAIFRPELDISKTTLPFIQDGNEKISEYRRLDELLRLFLNYNKFGELIPIKF